MLVRVANILFIVDIWKKNELLEVLLAPVLVCVCVCACV